MNCPRLREDLTFVEQTFRDEKCYIVKDPRRRKYYRFRALELVVIQEFDGERTVAEVAEALQSHGFPFSTASLEAFANRLHRMGLLERSVAEKSVLLMERLRAERRQRVKKAAPRGSILRMRWSVGDPNPLFDRWLPRLTFCFTRPFLILCAVLFGAYFAVVIAKWPQFWSAVASLYDPSSYTLGKIALLWGTGVIVIVIHEMGHAFTCKYFGGDVHEMGAMLLYFQPAFYCNVNDAWTFPDLRARLWVTAAGSWIQLAVAGAAAVVWWLVAPGTIVSEIALAAILVGGATTLLANANPLLPLDGYYALSDYLEVPNLRQRSFAYVRWVLKRFVLRLQAPRPPADPRERRILLVYGASALAYSAIILAVFVVIALVWLGRTVGALGVITGLVLLWVLLRGALARGYRAVVTSLREHRARWASARRWGWGGGMALAVLVLGAVVPWPIAVPGRFVVTTPMTMVLLANEPGVVEKVHATDGTYVEAGSPLVQLRNIALERQAIVLQRELDSLVVLGSAARARGQRWEARRLDATAAQRAAAREVCRERLLNLTVRAPAAGVVLTPRVEERVGSWLETGDHVVDVLAHFDSLELRVMVEGGGATEVAPGRRVRLIPFSDRSQVFDGIVGDVSTAGTGLLENGSLEVRVHVPPLPFLRPGVTGEAEIIVRRSTLLGALWWALRKHIRNDILL